jgi:predicted component of type VI protein secretion system
MKDEFEEAMQNILDYGLKAIDNLTAEELAEVQMIFEGIK